MTISFPVSQQTAPVPSEPKQPDDVTRFARLALVIGGLLSIAFTAAMLAFILWGWVSTFKTGAALWLSLLAMAWTLAAGFGAWWTFRLKVKRPIELEDEDRQARKPKVEIIYQTVDFPAVESFKHAGFKIISAHFFEYPKLTREQAESESIATQTEWNVFNTIAKHYQIRNTDNTWNSEKDEEALYLWHVTTFEMPTREAGVLVAHLSGGATLKFDLTKKGILKK